MTVGQSLGISARGWVIAIATGIQESGLRPLPYGDRDSLGVFQQRGPWGPAEVRMDPAGSARMFFIGGAGGQPGLTSARGWEQAPLTQAAQAVQASAYPDAYAKWEPAAVAIVQQLTGADGGCHPNPSSPPSLSPAATGALAQ